MNRLKGMRTYLAGAMDRVPDGGVGWRQTITPKLTEMGVVVLNPCDKPVEVGIEDDNTRKEIEILKREYQHSIDHQQTLLTDRLEELISIFPDS